MSIQHIIISNYPGDELDFLSTDIYVIDSYSNGDWNGNSSNHCIFHSDTSGSPSHICLSAVGDITVKYCDFQDIHIIDGTLTVQNGIDNGGNDGIVFETVSEETILYTNLFNLSSIIVKNCRDGNVYYPIYIDSITSELRISSIGIGLTDYQQICTSATVG